MPLPALVAAGLVSAGAKLASGALGSASQKSANKMNYKIAREANANQMLMQERANQFSAQMMREQQRYASPENQRKMLEQAGFNPYLYAGQSAVPGSSPSGSPGQALHAPQMMPVSAMADALGEASSEAAQVANTFAQAKKADAEAVGIDIENEYKVEQITQALRLMGLEEKAKSIELDYKNQKESLSVEELQNVVKMQGVQYDDLLLAYEINKEFKQQMTNAQYQNILEATNLMKEQGKTQENLRNYYDKMGDAGIMHAQAQQFLAKIEDFLKFNKNEMYGAAAEESRARAGVASQEYIIQGVKADIAKLYGKDQAKLELGKLVSSYKLDKATLEKMYKETKYLQKELDWYEVNKIINGIGSLSRTGLTAAEMMLLF